MIALDTNVLARALADDDRHQSELARGELTGLTPESPGFVSLTVMAELFWVLRRRLRLERDVVHDLIDGMLRTESLEVEDSESVGEALESARRGADFGDALIHATNRLYGVTETLTFDRDAARRFGWRLLA